MQDDQLDDLKQFIDSKISQSEANIRQDMHTGFQAVNQKMDDGFAGVGEAVDQIHAQLAERDTEVNDRLSKLEQAA